MINTKEDIEWDETIFAKFFDQAGTRLARKRFLVVDLRIAEKIRKAFREP